MPLVTPLARRRTTHLQQLFWLRNAALVIQGTALLVAVFWARIDLPVFALVAILCAIAAINIVTWMQLRRDTEITEPAILGQILLDVIALSSLLYFTGGSTNPFTVFYLLPLTLAASMLSRPRLWIVVLLAATCYSALLFFHVPITSVVDSHDLMMRMHVVGMWITFLMSAALIIYFVSRTRDREILLAQTREAMLRNERILAIGTMAAGAAHELGTPLTTIGVLAKELQDQYAEHPMLVDDLAVLRRQVESCKSTITNLLAAARQNRLDTAEARPAGEFVDEVTKKWQLIRPVVHFEKNVSSKAQAPTIVVDETLAQALMNILNNAADASPAHVEVATTWTDAHVMIDVMDRGPGFADAALQTAGHDFFSTKDSGVGYGIGLFLARATVERMGGALVLSHRDGGGSVARLILPVTRGNSS